MINAVIINHNSSGFTELAARSYFAMHSARSDLKFVIMDNSSTERTEDLKDYAESVGIEFRQSGWEAEGRQANSHGEVLRQFVMDDPDCDYYLLLDSDICFVMSDTIDQMILEIEDREETWAIQANEDPDSLSLFHGDRNVLTQDLSQYRSKERAQKNKLYLHHLI